MVAKLQDTILSVSTENAKYKKMIEDLTEKVFDQEKRLENLEKNYKKDDDFISELKTKKTKVVQNLGNDHSFVEGLDAKKTIPLVRNLQKTPSKRVATPGHGKTYFFFLLFHTSFSSPQRMLKHVFLFYSFYEQQREKNRQ